MIPLDIPYGKNHVVLTVELTDGGIYHLIRVLVGFRVGGAGR